LRDSGVGSGTMERAADVLQDLGEPHPPLPTRSLQARRRLSRTARGNPSPSRSDSPRSAHFKRSALSSRPFCIRSPPAASF
jgi:hypothetical protein